jgi:predicted nucleic acid-binding protein
MLNILKDLYQEIIITREVNDEFGSKLPDWIIVLEVKDKQRQLEIEKRLDKGEASSIALALEIENTTLIIDEIKGRKIAQSFEIEIIGTIGVLLVANNNGLIKDIISVILKLVNSGFRLSDKLLEQLIDKYGKH